MKLLLESMTRFAIGEYIVRVWREETEVMINRSDLDQVVNAITDEESGTMQSLANALIKVQRVNAVEVLNAAGDGIVLYRDWP